MVLFQKCHQIIGDKLNLDELKKMWLSNCSFVGFISSPSTCHPSIGQETKQQVSPGVCVCLLIMVKRQQVNK